MVQRRRLVLALPALPALLAAPVVRAQAGWPSKPIRYIVPFAPFGAFTISRAVQPQLFDYLYDLSEGDGADPTRPVPVIAIAIGVVLWVIFVVAADNKDVHDGEPAPKAVQIAGADPAMMAEAARFKAVEEHISGQA